MDIFYGLLLSAHLGLEKDYNWFHPHVGAYLDDQYKWTAGAYYNSEREISTYIAYTIDVSDTKFIDVGLVTGYSDADVKPMVKFNYNQFFVIPTVEEIITDDETRRNVGAVVGIEWRY